MSFTANFSNMKLFYGRLKALRHPLPVQSVLRDAMPYLCEHAAFMDVCVSQNSPFYQEFFQGIVHQKLDEDLCFALLECVIIFCREASLHRADVQACPAMEEALLKHFETSGIWLCQDNTLVGEWYWTILPLRHQT